MRSVNHKPGKFEHRNFSFTEYFHCAVCKESNLVGKKEKLDESLK